MSKFERTTFELEARAPRVTLAMVRRYADKSSQALTTHAPVSQERELHAQGRTQRRQQRLRRQDELPEREIVIYPEQFLKAVSDRVYSKENVTDRDIDQLFGLGNGLTGSFGGGLSGRERTRVREILNEVGPVLIGAMLNSPIFSQSVQLTRGFGNQAVERTAKYFIDGNAQEKLALHDFIHIAAQFEQTRRLEPPFLTEISEVNNPELLEEERMALLIGRFGNEVEPIVFMLIDGKKARAQARRLGSQALQAQGGLRGRLGLTEPIQEERVRRLRARQAIYNEAAALAESNGGYLPADKLYEFYQRDLTEIFREVQQDTAERILRGIYGNNISTARIAAERVKVREEYERVMEGLRVAPNQALVKRIGQIHAAYTAGDRKILFKILSGEMIEPLRGAINERRRIQGQKTIR